MQTTNKSTRAKHVYESSISGIRRLFLLFRHPVLGNVEALNLVPNLVHCNLHFPGQPIC